MQPLELEDDLRHCDGESKRPIIDISKVHDGAKSLHSDNNSDAGSEAANAFMALIVSQSHVRANPSNVYQTIGLNDMHNENRLDSSTLAVKPKNTITFLDCGISDEEVSG